MSKLNSVIDPLNIDQLKDLSRFCSSLLSDIQNLFNGNIEFVSNIRSQIISVSFTAANTEVAVPFTLNKTITGYYQVGSTAACSIYDGTTVNTTSILYLRSSAVATVQVLIF